MYGAAYGRVRRSPTATVDGLAGRPQVRSAPDGRAFRPVEVVVEALYVPGAARAHWARAGPRGPRREVQ
ncbi:hypothetical protein GCM10023199_44810 [Actinomycetospora chibensis]